MSHDYESLKLAWCSADLSLVQMHEFKALIEGAIEHEERVQAAFTWRGECKNDLITQFRQIRNVLRQIEMRVPEEPIYRGDDGIKWSVYQPGRYSGSLQLRSDGFWSLVTKTKVASDPEIRLPLLLESKGVNSAYMMFAPDGVPVLY